MAFGEASLSALHDCTGIVPVSIGQRILWFVSSRIKLRASSLTAGHDLDSCVLIDCDITAMKQSRAVKTCPCRVVTTEVGDKVARVK